MQNKDDATKSPITTVTSNVVYSNNWINVHEDAIIHPTGAEGIYAYVESKDSVMVVATNNKDEVFLVKAYRYPAKVWGWELPGGGADGEDPITAGKRELVEETGFTSDDWQIAGNPLVCNGLMTERMHILIARNVAAGIATDEEEAFLDKRFFSKNELDQMIKTGEIDDSQTLTGLYLHAVNKGEL
ncbi:MAG: putative hydrolase [Candidatus Saccharibacteria bacterium]|nr:putative hydrolase [Candidatus Saccharibacteria bacterium]